MDENAIKTIKTLTFLLVTLSIILLPEAVYAAQKGKLKDRDVRKFIEEMASMTSAGSPKSLPEIQTYLIDHVHDYAKFKSTITYNVPGHPPQETVMDLTKDQFIQSVEAGADAISGYESNIKIKSVQISGSGKSATVLTSSIESGYMAVPGENGGTERVPIEGKSDCTQVLVIGSADAIQVYSADCATSIDIQRF